MYDSLDEQWAVRHFLGKNLEEAEALFRENAVYYTESLMWMGPVAFRYYIHAAIRYVLSDAAARDACGLSELACALEFRLEYEADELAPVFVPLAAICDYLVQNAEKFEFGQPTKNCQPSSLRCGTDFDQ